MSQETSVCSGVFFSLTWVAFMSIKDRINDLEVNLSKCQSDFLTFNTQIEHVIKKSNLILGTLLLHDSSTSLV